MQRLPDEVGGQHSVVVVSAPRRLTAKPHEVGLVLANTLQQGDDEGCTSVAQSAGDGAHCGYVWLVGILGDALIVVLEDAKRDGKAWRRLISMVLLLQHVSELTE